MATWNALDYLDAIDQQTKRARRLMACLDPENRQKYVRLGDIANEIKALSVGLRDVAGLMYCATSVEHTPRSAQPDEEGT